MARYIGPKNKLSRREGTDLFDKGMKLRRLNIPPGIHGPKGRPRKESEYGKQLREKQKVKRMYGVLERQFRNYMNQAAHHPEETGQILQGLLESRLDNVIFRAGFAKTRAMARQLVVHGHVSVDGIKTDRPSYQIKAQEVITLKDKTLNMPGVIKMMEEETELPTWIEKKAGAIKIVRKPGSEDGVDGINMQLIVEYYSR